MIHFFWSIKKNHWTCDNSNSRHSRRLRFGTMELMFATKYSKSKSTSTLKKSRKTYLIFFYPLITDINKKVLNYLNYLSQRKESHRFPFLLPFSRKKLHQVKLFKRKTLLALLQSQQLKGACVESWVTYHLSLWKSGQYYIPKKILYKVTHDSDLQKKRERERKRERQKKQLHGQ